MNKKSLVTVGIVLVLTAGVALSAVTAVYAFPGHAGYRHGRMFRHMARQLNLTDAQKTQIKDILKAEKPRVQPLMQQLRDNRKAQNANYTGVFDEAQARAFANKQAQIMSDLAVEHERVKAQIYAVLTPEQRQKAKDLMQEHRQRREKFLQNSPGSPGE
ncbi:MAG TPA: Spy/CpxP family protein refolding chaperone [Alphaproteobacteria bacterium]|nr:Spy/CpxP family protein refolding chaperone [Alphaproteobacteria bacterium]